MAVYIITVTVLWLFTVLQYFGCLVDPLTPQTCTPSPLSEGPSQTGAASIPASWPSSPLPHFSAAPPIYISHELLHACQKLLLHH